MEEVSNIPEVNLPQASNKNLPLFQTMIFLFLGTILGLVIAVGILYLKPDLLKSIGINSNENVNNQTNEVQNTKNELPEDNNEVVEVESLKFTHKNLSDFTFTYPETWNVKVLKEFGVNKDVGISGVYFPNCAGDYCMPVQLSKGSTKVNLIFNNVLDDSGVKCSNSAEYKKLNNGWYRIKDSSGYIYSKYVRTDFQGEFGYPGGKTTDEWSSIDNRKYDVCLVWMGMHFKGESKYIAEQKDEGGLMLEHIKVSESIANEDLLELDKIIESAKPTLIDFVI